MSEILNTHRSSSKKCKTSHYTNNNLRPALISLAAGRIHMFSIDGLVSGLDTTSIIEESDSVILLLR